MAKLSAAQRKKMPTSSFAVPAKAKTASGKAASGSYPIPDLAHARDALARSSGKPVEAQVRAKVVAKYPQLKKGGKK